jgi:hypothetical protein
VRLPSGSRKSFHSGELTRVGLAGKVRTLERK